MLKRIREMFKNEKGLTLVELLAVIVILAVIAAIAFVFIGGIINNSKKDAHIANAQQVIEAAKLYQATEGDLSTGLTVDKFVEKDYLEKLIDPWSKDPYADLASVKVEIENTGDNAGDLKIVGFNPSQTGDKGCQLTATETDLIKEDRDEICK